MEVKNFQNFLDHSEICFCFTIHKKLNKSYSLKKFFFVPEKKIVSLKNNFFLVGPTLEDFNSSWLWLLRGVTFHPVVVIGLGMSLLFKSVLAFYESYLVSKCFALISVWWLWSDWVRTNQSDVGWIFPSNFN